MSIEAEVFLVCDRCTRRATTHTSVSGMAYLRRDEPDWVEVRSGRREDWDHYCPECAERRGLK